MWGFLSGIVLCLMVVTHAVFAMVQGHLIIKQRQLTEDDPPMLPTWAWIIAALILGPAVVCLYLLLRGVPELAEDVPEPLADVPVPSPVTGNAVVAPPVLPPTPKPPPPAEPPDPNSPFA